MSNTSPNGCFSGNVLVLTDGCVSAVARGFELTLPDFSQADASVLNNLQDQVRLALRSLPEQQRLQIQWFCDGDYGASLDRYQRESERTGNAWVGQCRTERVDRYRAQMRTGQLRRQRLVLFVTQQLVQQPPLTLRPGLLRKHLERALSRAADGLNLSARTFGDALVGQGSSLAPMGALEHYRLYARMLNPSLDDRPDYDPQVTFDPALSIQDNCWLSEAVGNSMGFDLDGYSHGLLVLTRWPQSTYPGILQRLTHLHAVRFQITLNIEPLPVMAEIQKEERRYARLQGEYKAEGRPSLATVLEKKEQKIQQLMKGFLRPFRVQFIVRIWARNPDELTLAMAVLKQAINGMNGAQYFQPALPATTRKLWFQTWPGWTWGPCRRWHLYGEDTYLADLLPLTSSASGYLAEAEAIYDGPQGSLVGVKTTSQPGSMGAPQHAVVFGATGSGKSMLMADLLTQTSVYYDLHIMVDRGLSHEALMPLLEPTAAPIVLRPNGNITLNPFDTQGLPLTSEHIARLAALAAQMCGSTRDETADRLRRALLAKFSQRLGDDVFEQWQKEHPQELDAVARLGCILEQRRGQSPDATLLDLFVDFRDWASEHADQAAGLLQTVSEADILRTLNNPASRRQVRDLAFARLPAAEQPTLRMLQELLDFDASTIDRPLAHELALLLLPWCADGSHGPLFDGPTNITLEGPLLYFELGQIPESATDLMMAVNFLVQSWVWQRIYTLPRSRRKRMIIEEAAAFLAMPGAADIVQRAYEQARKYSTWIVTVFQQYAPLRTSPIRAAVLGNSQQFFILKQNDPEDLRQLAADLDLSQTAVDEILRYPKPEQAGYSAFTYFHRDTPHPVCATAYHRPSPEMAYLTTTTGAHVERRRNELKAAQPLSVSSSPNSQPHKSP